MLKLKDKLLLHELQNNFPLSSRPYSEIAKKLRLTEDTVMNRVKTLMKKKIIRYVGGIFDTKKLGIQSSLVAMSVSEQRLQKVVSIINAYPEISHNYLRDAKFNLWFTLSAADKNKLENLLSDIRRKTGINRILNLSTVRVFKIDSRFNLKTNKKSQIENINHENKRPKSKNFKIDKGLIIKLNKPLSITARPFLALAKKLKMSEDRLLSLLKEYRKNGLLRRLGVILNHQKIGFKVNGLVAWRVPIKRIDGVAKIFRKFPQISHFYQRKVYPAWPYNLYTMMHCRDRDSCLSLVKSIARKSGIKDYRVLFTLKEFKKTKSNLRSLLR
jgi:DNA-binding Lrp family transcriptional regulator